MRLDWLSGDGYTLQLFSVVVHSRKKPVIGLLGGVGSGKSTVARAFGRLGCGVVDADALAHEALEQPQVKRQVVELLGPGVLDEDGRIDRGRVAEVVFADASKLAGLTGIIHPVVLAKTRSLMEAYRRDPGVRAIVLDMPLLVEVGWHRKCDRLVFVRCDREKRLARAQNKVFGRKNDAGIRENLQISLDKKIRLADNIVENNSDESALASQVADIFSNIVANT